MSKMDNRLDLILSQSLGPQQSSSGCALAI